MLSMGAEVDIFSREDEDFFRGDELVRAVGARVRSERCEGGLTVGLARSVRTPGPAPHSGLPPLAGLRWAARC